MTLKELNDILAAVYPTAYWSFPENEAPALPYITYFEDAAANFGADNRVYHSARSISIELLTKSKNPDAEAAVEAALDENDIYWTKTETHLDDEDAFEVIYNVEV